MLQLMGSQRVRHEQVTALNLLKLVTYIKSEYGLQWNCVLILHKSPNSKMLFQEMIVHHFVEKILHFFQFLSFPLHISICKGQHSILFLIIYI